MKSEPPRIGSAFNSICSFWLINDIWGVVSPPPLRISKTTERMTIKPLPDVKPSEEERNQKFVWHNLTGLWTKVPKTRFLEMQLLGKLTSQNFARLAILDPQPLVGKGPI